MRGLMDHQRDLLRRATQAAHNSSYFVEIEGKRYYVSDVTNHPCTNEVIIHAKPIRSFDENQDVPAQQQGQ